MGDRIRGRRGVALRKARLAAEPLCRRCKERGLTTAATVPDHVLALANGGEDVDTNIQCLCDACHQQKTAEDLGYRKGVDADGWPIAPTARTW